jgi:hypothetical protein
MRAFNRVASALLGLILLAAGVVTVIEVILAASGGKPMLPLRNWYSWLTRTDYASNAFKAIAVCVGVVGLLILISQLRRWRPAELELSPGESAKDRWLIDRHSLQDEVASEVSTVPGVTEASAEVSGKPDRWRLRVSASASEQQSEQVKLAARRALDRLSVPEGVSLGIDLRPPGRVA